MRTTEVQRLHRLFLARAHSVHPGIRCFSLHCLLPTSASSQLSSPIYISFCDVSHHSSIFTVPWLWVIARTYHAFQGRQSLGLARASTPSSTFGSVLNELRTSMIGHLPYMFSQSFNVIVFLKNRLNLILRPIELFFTAISRQLSSSIFRQLLWWWWWQTDSHVEHPAFCLN